MKPCHQMKKRVFLSTNSPWCYRMWVTIQLANTCAWQPMMQAKGPASKCFWTSNVSNTARVSSWLDSENNVIEVFGIQKWLFKIETSTFLFWAIFWECLGWFLRWHVAIFWVMFRVKFGVDNDWDRVGANLGQSFEAMYGPFFGIMFCRDV